MGWCDLYVDIASLPDFQNRSSMVQQVLIVGVDSPFFSEKKESQKDSKKPSPGNTQSFSYFIDTEGHCFSTTNGLSKREASTIVSIFFEQMAIALDKGDRLEIRGLCSFYVKEYKGYNGRNPKTGETIRVESNYRIFSVNLESTEIWF